MFQFLRRRPYPRYGTTTKAVGETPLIATERFRLERGISKDVPLAYAGRLDPMAEGKLLILIGDECKIQEKYHAFDKEYIVEMLLGASSDTGDVLGDIRWCKEKSYSRKQIECLLQTFVGDIQLPYPHFSSKTVQGKPLHVWTLEKRLHEIQIPTKRSSIHEIALIGVRPITKEEILKTVREKIEKIPQVTDERKALGADFRRDLVRGSWNNFEKEAPHTCTLVTFRCIASSGTYMRSLAEKISNELRSCGLAYSIERTIIGKYRKLPLDIGFWSRKF